MNQDENSTDGNGAAVAETPVITSPFPAANRAPEIGGTSDAPEAEVAADSSTAPVAAGMTTQGFFTACVPKPTAKNFHVQLGCHVEEIVETLKSFTFKNQDRNSQLGVAVKRLEKLSEELKNGKARLADVNWDEFIDGMADTRVTAIGAIHMTGYDVGGVIAEIDSSNESKLVDGKPVFDENGKIKKGETFFRPNLGQYAPEGGVTVLAK